jgi:hypothetical protein
MRKSRYAEEQIVGIVKGGRSGSSDGRAGSTASASGRFTAGRRSTRSGSEWGAAVAAT